MAIRLPVKPTTAAIQQAREQCIQALVSARTDAGCWCGELSSSALSTATAVTALSVVDRARQQATHRQQALAGLTWLANHANEDGGWGDTTRSLSNLSTTTLCWAAFGIVPDASKSFEAVIRRAENWLKKTAGGLDAERLAPAIIARYGKDRTFSVPILTMCALSGRFGDGPGAWKHVIALPFELAALPHQWFAAVRLPVVSYALPALIAIGQAKFVHHAPANPIARLTRAMTRQRTLKVLDSIQPSNGGFLEATPLTSFVTMSLAGSDQADHAVTRRGVEFLRTSQREDGSWPIDTNLATWVTTLSINAIGSALPRAIKDAQPLVDFLSSQQYTVRHPYTDAAPGGWAWTDLPGGVPDADDTAGALIALHQLKGEDAAIQSAAARGVTWLLNLQNRDGGMPTFCRGWGALPFDRSSADLTAHALRAWIAWHDRMPERVASRIPKAIQRAVGFLARTQRPDGSWVPLWFGNQHVEDDENPTYGTSRVLCGLAEVERHSQFSSPAATELCALGRQWLEQAQNEDGSWGGARGIRPSIEETALALEALAALNISNETIDRGTLWLLQKIKEGQWKDPSPIGFYFAKLWYYESLYPLIFTVAALNR